MAWYSISWRPDGWNPDWRLGPGTPEDQLLRHTELNWNIMVKLGVPRVSQQSAFSSSVCGMAIMRSWWRPNCGPVACATLR